jgi:cell surface protein SprA
LNSRKGELIRGLILVTFALTSMSCGTDNTANPEGSEPVEVTGLALDIDYLANRYFYLDPPSYVFSAGVFRPDRASLNVFVEDFSPANPWGGVQFAAYAVADEESDGLGDVAEDDLGSLYSFRLLEPDREYSIIADSNDNFLGIWLNLLLGEADILAVSYKGRNDSGDSLTVGDIDLSEVNGWYSENPDTLLLELIKPENNLPESPTWDYMMRNIYSLGGRDIDYSTLEVEIIRRTTRPDATHPEGFPQFPYLQIFGLDQFDVGTEGFGHDSKVDKIWIDTQNGLLRFPADHAFDPSVEEVFAWTRSELDSFYLDPEDYDRNAAIYNVPHRDLFQDPAYHKYRIEYHWRSK